MEERFVVETQRAREGARESRTTARDNDRGISVIARVIAVLTVRGGNRLLGWGRSSCGARGIRGRRLTGRRAGGKMRWMRRSVTGPQTTTMRQRGGAVTNQLGVVGDAYKTHRNPFVSPRRKRQGQSMVSAWRRMKAQEQSSCTHKERNTYRDPRARPKHAAARGQRLLSVGEERLALLEHLRSYCIDIASPAPLLRFYRNLLVPSLPHLSPRLLAFPRVGDTSRTALLDCEDPPSESSSHSSLDPSNH